MNTAQVDEGGYLNGSPKSGFQVDAHTRYRAVRTLARAATDATELAEFLAMSGLTPQEGRNHRCEYCH